MSGQERPYVRVYYSIVDDPKFERVYDSDTTLATWLRLLLTADAAYPASAAFPAGTDPGSVALLEEADLIRVVSSGRRYNVVGLPAERLARDHRGVAGGVARASRAQRDASGRMLAHAGPPATQRAEPSLTKPKRDVAAVETPNRAPAPAREERRAERADVAAFDAATNRLPTARQMKILDDMLDRHDEAGPQWAAAIILEHPDDPIGAVILADKAWRAERLEAAKNAERKPPQPRRPRKVGLTGINAELAALLREQEKRA